jgi:hypothetical protein
LHKQPKQVVHRGPVRRCQFGLIPSIARSKFRQKGNFVLRVSLTWVFEQLEAISGLDVLTTDSKGLDAWLKITSAKDCLRSMMAGSVYAPFLKVSFKRASALFDVLESHVPETENVNEDLALTDYDVWNINNHREQFESVFRAELATVPIFLITHKGPFDVDRLIENGTELFPSNLLSKVPEAEIEALEIGKCLAFERSTACGFHTFRLLEAALRRYWDAVTNGQPRPDNQTLGVMTSQLFDKQLGDTKVLEALKQITKLHRNPIAHPEVVLSLEEARAIIGMSHSVLAHMLMVLPDVPQTTSIAIPPHEGE